MIKRMLLVGVLVIGTGPLAVAGSLQAAVADHPVHRHASTAAEGCWGESGNWLPGTLQTDDLAPKADQPVPVPAIQWAQGLRDCALV